MSSPWKTIENRALKDWQYMESLSDKDKQMLYSFLTFFPAIAERKHLILESKSGVEVVLKSLRTPGGVWWDPAKVPFDRLGRSFVEHTSDDLTFPENFHLWALPENQRIVYEYCETRFDEQSFSAIIPATSDADLIREIDLLDPSNYRQCLEQFTFLLPRLKWLIVLLHPTAKYSIFVANESMESDFKRVGEALASSQIIHFPLIKREHRFYWEGPTEWS